MCFLRSEGRAGEAQAIGETEFAEAAARARGACASEFEAESILKALLEEEEERVASAIAFAEVLLPMLSKRLPGLALQGPGAPAAPAPRRERVPGRDESRGIADFIDDMLAQERTGTR